MNLKYNKENCGLLLEESSNFRTFMVVNIARSTVIFPIYKAINPHFFNLQKKKMLETLYQYLKLNTEIGSAIISKPPPAPPAVPPTAPAAPPLPLTLTPPAKTKINNLRIGHQKKFKYISKNPHLCETEL